MSGLHVICHNTDVVIAPQPTPLPNMFKLHPLVRALTSDWFTSSFITVYENFLKVQPEFSVQSTTKIIPLIKNDVVNVVHMLARDLTCC